jgi:hypothetical protein
MGVPGFLARQTMEMNIHNQCSDLKLTGREDFSDGAEMVTLPNSKVNAGDMISAGWSPFLATFEGALMYELEIEGAGSAYIRFLVAWKSERYKEFRVFIHLIEHDEWCHWNKPRLKKYYQGYVSRLSTYTGPVKDTWLTRDGKVLMTRLELNHAWRSDVLNITISEGVKDDHIRRPVWLDPKM